MPCSGMLNSDGSTPRSASTSRVAARASSPEPQAKGRTTASLGMRDRGDQQGRRIRRRRSGCRPAWPAGRRRRRPRRRRRGSAGRLPRRPDRGRPSSPSARKPHRRRRRAAGPAPAAASVRRRRPAPGTAAVSRSEASSTRPIGEASTTATSAPSIAAESRPPRCDGGRRHLGSGGPHVAPPQQRVDLGAGGRKRRRRRTRRRPARRADPGDLSVDGHGSVTLYAYDSSLARPRIRRAPGHQRPDPRSDVSQEALENLSREDRAFPPTAEFAAQANATAALYDEAAADRLRLLGGPGRPAVVGAAVLAGARLVGGAVREVVHGRAAERRLQLRRPARRGRLRRPGGDPVRGRARRPTRRDVRRAAGGGVQGRARPDRARRDGAATAWRSTCR